MIPDVASSLPRPGLMPDRVYTLPELRYPRRLNVARELLDADDYKRHLREIGGVYREHFGKHFPAMTLVEVKSLYDDDCAIEVEGVAVLD